MALETDALKWGQWLPDLPPLGNPGCLEAENVLPNRTSYRSLPALEASSDPVPGDKSVVRATVALDTTGLASVFVATQNALFILTGDGWRNVSRDAGYSISADWNFVNFKDQVIATNGIDPPQHFDLSNLIAGKFADIDGAPIAQYAAVVRDFLILGKLADDPNTIRWSGFGDYQTWTPSLKTQSGFQDLSSDAGRVQGLVSGTSGLILQDFSLSEILYQEPPITFRLMEHERDRGTPAPRSVIWYGRRVYYYSHDGFYFYDFATHASEQIGQDRVDAWFEKICPRNRLDRIQGAIDINNGLVFWAFPTSEGLPYNDHVLVYNWIVDRWSLLRVNVHYLTQMSLPGVTLEELDSEENYGGSSSMTGSIDTVGGITFDSDIWKRGALTFVGFMADEIEGEESNNNKAAAFTNPQTLRARLVSRETIGKDNSFQYVNAIRPLIEEEEEDSSTIGISIGYRDRTRANLQIIGPRPLNRIGEANIRSRHRFHRYIMETRTPFEHAHGLLLTKKPSAGRKV